MSFYISVQSNLLYYKNKRNDTWNSFDSISPPDIRRSRFNRQRHRAPNKAAAWAGTSQNSTSILTQKLSRERWCTKVRQTLSWEVFFSNKRISLELTGNRSVSGLYARFRCEVLHVEGSLEPRGKPRSVPSPINFLPRLTELQQSTLSNEAVLSPRCIWQIFILPREWRQKRYLQAVHILGA